jgi:excisionase family DNA binding protein
MDVVDSADTLLHSMESAAYMPIPEVAEELGISTSGVYKLISRGKLPAIRRSERGLRVPRMAFEAYKRRLQGHEPVVPPPLISTATLQESRAGFERETGLSPAEWERRWKADEIEDSAENMARAIRALGLLLREEDERSRSGTPHGDPATAHRSAA